jgi:hypothetical protein
MTFLFVQGKRSKVIHGKLSGVLGEAAVSLATVKRWCPRFKNGNFGLDDELSVLSFSAKSLSFLHVLLRRDL